MLPNALSSLLFLLSTTMLVLFVAKVFIFIRQRHGHDYQFMCLLYFPGIDIMLTSDSREKRDKKMQNKLTRIIFLIGIVVLFIINLQNYIK